MDTRKRLLRKAILTDEPKLSSGAGLEVGQPVAMLSGGGFAEYVVVPARFCLPTGTLQKEVVALLTSGLTASIGAALHYVLHCTILHSTPLHCTALHCTALHCTALLCPVLLTALHCSQHCTALHCTAHSIALPCPALHCTAWCPIVFRRNLTNGFDSVLQLSHRTWP